MGLSRVFSNQIAITNHARETLKVGDITKGKVLALYPDQKASIQLGEQTIVAQLETSLTNLKSYYFQVEKRTLDTIHLKVLREFQKRKHAESYGLLEILGFKTSKQRLFLLDGLLSERLPFNKEQLAASFELLDRATDKNDALSILKEMVARQLPLNREIFYALLRHSQSTVSTELNSIMQVLNEEPGTKLTNQLQEMVNVLLKKENMSEPKQQFLQQLHRLWTNGGSTSENSGSTMTHGNITSMKSLLVQLLHNSEGSVQDRVNQLLHFLNGLQLQSVDETDNFINAYIQIPAEKLGLHGDVSVDLFSQKNETGEMNPDFCRIIFYLDLVALRQTVIDMHIQKRAVTLKILNDYQRELEQISATLQNALQEGLKKLDFDLRTIQFKPHHSGHDERNATNTNVYSTMRQGVDYRI